jgi:hypothetical protein
MNYLQILADAKTSVQEGMNKTGVGTATTGDLGTMVSKITTAIFIVLGIVAVFVIILGGFNMMTSSGDPGKVKKGKDTILWGIIGLIVAILSYAIVNFVLKQL